MDSASSYRLQCPECKKRFPTSTDCRRHRRLHDKDFPCISCGYCFGTKKDLNRHRITHEKLDKDGCIYKCLVPGCKFGGAGRKDNLWKHMKNKHLSGAFKVPEKDLRDYYNKAESMRDLSKLRAGERNLELLEAAYQGDEEKAKECIREGADISIRDKRGNNAAYIAIDRGHTNLLKLVLQAGIDPYSLLYRAVEHGSIEMVKTILDSGLEINIEEIYHGPSRLSGDQSRVIKSPLTCASMKGHAAIAQILLDHGAKTDDPARTEFLFIRGHIDVVRILVAREHDIDRRYGQFGATLLHLVAVNHAELIEELIQKGFKVNARDYYNRTPLSYALGSTSYQWLSGM